MLGKLLKYEFKATQRTFLPLFGLILVFAGINKLFMQLNFQHVNGATSVAMGAVLTIYIVLIVAVFVMTLIVTIQRFQKNLLSDEGYLSFTLPVKVHSHIDAKMIASLVWSILSVIVAGLSALILVADRNTFPLIGRFFRGLGEYTRNYGGMGWLIVGELIVLALISTLTGILQIYNSMAVGNLCSRHKLLASFGTFLGFGILQQIIASIIIGGWYGSEKFWDDLFHNIDRFTNWQAMNMIASVLGIIILFVALFGVAFYFFTDWLLSKKLNLE